MSRTKIMTLILLSALAGSCSKFTTRIRLKPQLVYENGLLISNSQTNPYKFVFENDLLKINYNIIVKNISEKSIEINLENAFYQANDEKNNLHCLFYHISGTTHLLKKDEQVAISCMADITPNPTNKLTFRDTDIKLAIPLDKTVHSFMYRVYAEEFTK